MKGTWGRRVFGTVTRGRKFTRFQLELRLQNNCVMTETQLVSNEKLEQYPKAYGYALDLITYKLEMRLAERIF